MFAGHATLLKLKQQIICSAFILPQSMLKLTLNISDTNTDEKTSVFVAVPALSTTAVITAANLGST